MDFRTTWKDLDSVLSFDQFLSISKVLDKEKNVFCSAYIALSFNKPGAHTLQKFKLYLQKIAVIEQSSSLLQMLACRICTTVSTTFESTAIQLIMEDVPTSDIYPLANCVFIADFKAKRCHCTSILPPLSLPYLKSDAFRKMDCEVINRFHKLPEFLKTDGIRLVRNAQKKGYLSKGEELSHFNRIDLMALHFLYHSTELPPLERYYVEKGTPFVGMQKNPMEQMGNAMRAYFEHDFPYLLFQFERGVEGGEIIYWEKNDGGFPIMKKIEVIDPLSFRMEDLIKLVDWIDTLFYMEKVQRKIDHE